MYSAFHKLFTLEVKWLRSRYVYFSSNYAGMFFLIQAASLSINNEFKSGRLLAYKLMCAMAVCHQDVPLTQEYLTHFYRLMHIGLTGTDQVSHLYSNIVT